MRFALLAARLGLLALVLAALLAALAIFLVRAGLASFFPAGLEVMTGSVVLGLMALGLAVTWLVSGLKHNNGAGARIGMAALLGSLLLLYTPLRTVYQGLMAPSLHDVTTDPEDPPQFVALAKRPPGFNSTKFDATAMIHYRGEYNTVSYMLHEYYAGITKPLQPILPPTPTNPAPPEARMFWRCFNTAKKMGWEIVDYNQAQGRLEMKARSFWFGQVSDIVVRVRPAGPLGARFDMRAESEIGQRDFGHNLALMKAYRGALAS